MRLSIQIWHSRVPGATSHGVAFGGVGRPQPASAQSTTECGEPDASVAAVAQAHGVAAVIRIDAVWLAVDPIDMRAGADGLLARVVQVFGAAKSHHGYLFANARCTRIK